MFNQKYLEVLACPSCKGPLVYRESAQQLVCEYEQLAYPVKDGIMMLEASHAVNLAPSVPQTPAEHAYFAVGLLSAGLVLLALAPLLKTGAYAVAACMRRRFAMQYLLATVVHVLMLFVGGLAVVGISQWGETMTLRMVALGVLLLVVYLTDWVLKRSILKGVQ